MLSPPGSSIFAVAHDGVRVPVGVEAGVEVQAQVVFVFPQVQHEARERQAGLRRGWLALDPELTEEKMQHQPLAIHAPCSNPVNGKTIGQQEDQEPGFSFWPLCVS